MKRTIAVAAAAVALMATACSGSSTTKHPTPTVATTATSRATTVPTSAAPHVNAGDVALILAMYKRITQAFQHNPDDGVRAIIATQYPGDRADVDFARCINAIVPGATTLPRSKALRFVPNAASIAPDPGYTLTSTGVRRLHPTGRIYTTDVTITQGTVSSVHKRHQVVQNGKAYQFSTC